MRTLHFEIAINAPVAKVWNNVTGDKPYRDWASAFSPGSHFEGDWNQGSKIRFLAEDQDGKKEGMVSEIAENRIHEFISIRHIGFIKDGVEDTTGPEVKQWAPSYENYTFTGRGSATTFAVDMDVQESWVTMMEAMWPAALSRLKEISEQA